MTLDECDTVKVAVPGQSPLEAESSLKEVGKGAAGVTVVVSDVSKAHRKNLYLRTLLQLTLFPWQRGY